MKPPSLVPLIQWLETQGLVRKGTTQQVNTLADQVRQLDAALRAAGVLRA